MSDDDGSNGTDSNPQGKANPKESPNVNRFLPTPTVTVRILGGIAGAFCLFGSGLLNAQFFYRGWGIIWLGGCFGCIALRIWVRNHKNRHQMPKWLDSNWAFGFIVCIFAIACFSAAFLSSSKPQEPPSISLEPEHGSPVAPKDPFGTILVIQSKTLVSNVWARAYWHNGNVPANNFGFIVTNIADRLPPMIGQNVDFYDVEKSYGEMPFATRAFVNVDVRFTPGGLPYETNQTFQFFVRRGDNGDYHWSANGAGKSMEEVSKECRGLPFPLLDVRVTSVEDNFQFDKQHPFKISYTWQNWGQSYAKNVYIEWGVWDGQHVLFWTNTWDKKVFDQLLAPAESNSTYTTYSDKTHPAILNGILSGNLMLLGTAKFKDFESNEYEIDMKAIRTNGAFDVRYIRLGGHYGEINKKFGVKPLPGMLPPN